MSWAKLDDRFPNHPKVVAAGGDAAWLYVAALCYTNEHITGGFVPAAAVSRLTDRRQPTRLAARLCEVGLWEAVTDGYQIHDYSDWNEGAEEIKARREATRKRVAKWRAEHEGSNGVTQADLPGVTDAPVTALPRARAHTRGRSDADSDSKAEEKPRKKRKDLVADRAATVPMPFTLAQLCDALRGQTDRLLVDPFDATLVTPLTAAVRALAAGGGTLDDVHLAGAYVASGGLDWATQGPLTLSWLATAGKLSGLVARARAWESKGRPALGGNGKQRGGASFTDAAQVEEMRQLVDGPRGGRV